MKKSLLVLVLIFLSQLVWLTSARAYPIFSATDDSTLYTSSNSDTGHWEVQYLGVAPRDATIHSVTLKITNPAVQANCATLFTDTNLFSLATTSTFAVGTSTGAESTDWFLNDWDLAGFAGTPTTTPAVNGACTFFSSTGYRVFAGDAYTLWLTSRFFDPYVYTFLGSSNSTPTNFGEANNVSVLTALHAPADLYYVLDSEPYFATSTFYAKIKNTISGSMNLRNGSSTSADVIKTLPEDWIVKVASTTDAVGGPVTADGYNWFQVTDPTDNVSGWMIGEDDSGTVHHLSYDAYNQTNLEASSTATSSASWPDLVLTAIDHYYNDTNTAESLYSSDDNSGNKISQLKTNGYPEKLILGIAAYEDGPSFNNESVSFDYGHGIMQPTFDAWYYEPASSASSTFDNTGIASHIKIVPCASLASRSYINCYTNAGTADGAPKSYQSYGGNSSNPTYKVYSSTTQSIYANIKDGLYVLAHANSLFSTISASTTVNGVTYSPNDIQDILTTQHYNGGGTGACGYVDIVASRLDDIGSYFPGATTSDISDLVQKMHNAASTTLCAELHSPGDLTIQDSKGLSIGSVNGKTENDFPLAIYDKDKKSIVILAAGNDDYTYKVTGTGTGTYGLDITIKTGNQKIAFKASDIAIMPGEVHTYKVNKDLLSHGLNGVTLDVDRNGDGISDRTLMTGALLTGGTYNLGATNEELEAFKVGDVHPYIPVVKQPVVSDGFPTSSWPVSRNSTLVYPNQKNMFMSPNN